MSVAASNWVRGVTDRSKYKFTGYKGEEVVIPQDMKCVYAVYTKSKDGYWEVGEENRDYVLTENGYCISFKREPEIVGTADKNDGRVKENIQGCSTQLYRLVWFSFAYDAARNNTEYPDFLLKNTDGYRSKAEGDKLTVEELNELLEGTGKYGRVDVHHKNTDPESNALAYLKLETISEHNSLTSDERRFTAEGHTIKWSNNGIGIPPELYKELGTNFQKSYPAYQKDGYAISVLNPKVRDKLTSRQCEYLLDALRRAFEDDLKRKSWLQVEVPKIFKNIGEIGQVVIVKRDQ